MKDVQHSAPNLAISACGKAQQWDLALSVFESANTFKIEPSIITLNVAISACEKKNQWEGAWNLLGSGRAAALEVSVVTRNAMLSAFGKGAQWQRALFLLRAEDMPTPDILSFNAAIAACERGKKWQEALCLLREVEDLSCPDVITYNSAISSLRETTGLCRGRRTSLNMSSTNHRFLGEASGPRDQPRAANVWSWGSECLGVFFFLPSEASMKHHFKESDGSGASASGSPSGSRSGRAKMIGQPSSGSSKQSELSSSKLVPVGVRVKQGMCFPALVCWYFFASWHGAALRFVFPTDRFA